MPARSPLETLLECPTLGMLFTYLNCQEIVRFTSLCRASRSTHGITKTFLRYRVFFVAFNFHCNSFRRYELTSEETVDGEMVLRRFKLIFGGPPVSLLLSVHAKGVLGTDHFGIGGLVDSARSLLNMPIRISVILRQWIRGVPI